MKDYTKKKARDEIVTARIPKELKKTLMKLKLNVSQICRDALQEAVQTLVKK